MSDNDKPPSPRRRKTHGRSKKGCAECKRRHMKCDERQPVCANCAAAKLTCPFEALWDGSSEALNPSPGRFLERESNLPFGRLPRANLATPEVNMVHIELFNKFITETCSTFSRTDEHTAIYRVSVVTCSFAYPFLMHGMLALAAFHFSIQRPHQRDFYRHQATSLQAVAVVGLKHSLTQVDEHNCLAILFFSHIIGVHSFCDAFTYKKDSFGEFLNRLTHSMRLLQGVNAVIRPWWACLAATEMGKLILDADERRNSSTIIGSTEDTAQLLNFIQSADISDTSRQVYTEAINRLQRDFNLQDDSDEPLTTTNTVFSWLVTSSSEYIDLLEERRPEALMVLAYYAVILHKRRGSWAIADAGQVLLSLIDSYVGPRWEQWLSWPKARVFGRTNIPLTPRSTS